MAAMLGDGTTLQIDDGVSNAYALVTTLIDIVPPNPDTPKIKCTALDTTPEIELYIPGTRQEMGEFTYTLYYGHTEYARAIALKGISHNFKITYPDTHTSIIPGWISKVEKSKIENQVPETMTVTVVINGTITEA